MKALMTDVGNVDKVSDTYEAFKGAVDDIKMLTNLCKSSYQRRKGNMISMTGMNPE